VSSSPTGDAPADNTGYERSWEALNKMLRDGSSLSGRERHCVYLNTGAGTFADASAVSGLDLADDGRGAARVDWDQDGALDLWVTNRSGPRLRFLRNRGTDAGAFVALRLEGRDCNRDAIGARVEVRLEDGRRLAETLRAGEGYLAQSSKWLHFGLGDAAAIAGVTVRWPGGETESFAGTAPGGRYHLAQGSGAAALWTRPGPAPAFEPSTPEPARMTEVARNLLVGRVPLPSIWVADRAGEPIVLSGVRKRPALLVVWASWCRPCLGELKELVDARATIEALGLDVVAVSADQDVAAADQYLDSIAWPYAQGRASNKALDVLDLLQRMQLERRRRLALPTSFLIDTAGMVAAIYKGPLELATVQADAARLDDGPDALRDAAVPFSGRWFAPPPKADLEWLADRFEERGLRREANELRVRQFEIRELTQAGLSNEIGLIRARQGRMDQAVELFAEAARLEPDWFDAHRNLGSALHELGRLDEAAASYEIALRFRPRDQGTIHNLALAYVLLREDAKAADLLGLLRNLSPEAGAELAAQIQRVEANR
jgi:tetratricopeptide (TPR) repeat protein